MQKIHNDIYRALLCLLILTLGGAAYADTTPWGVADASKPAGAGTQNDPYIIATAQNLFWLSLNIGAEADKWYVQTADIDLEEKEWMPIGNYFTGPFKGHYDGQGHRISGLRIDWSNYARGLNHASKKEAGNITSANSSNISYGLFGWLCGSVQNLVIDDAKIYKGVTSQTAANAGSSSDFRLGILAGNVGGVDNSTIIIKNIIITNSEISDGRDIEGQLYGSAYMIGGVFGDVHGGNAYDGSTAVVGGKYEFSNIYSAVNIDLAHTKTHDGRTFSSKGQQFYVGGIVGRARSLTLNQFPKNYCLYTGTIDAPWAMIGPIFGGARNSAAAVNTTKGLINTFAGDIVDSPEGASTKEDFSTSWFTDYKVKNYLVEQPEMVTMETSNLIENTKNGSKKDITPTYTFKQQPEGSTTTLKLEDITLELMSTFQGINRGNYLAPGDVASKMNAPEGSGYTWTYNSNVLAMQREAQIEKSISDGADGYTYTATFTTSRVRNDQYVIKWFCLEPGVDSREIIDFSEAVSAGDNVYSSTVKYLASKEGSKIMAVLYDGVVPLESVLYDVDVYAELSVEHEFQSRGNAYHVKVNLHKDGGVTTLPASLFNYDWTLLVNYNTEYKVGDEHFRFLQEDEEYQVIGIVCDHGLTTRQIKVSVTGKDVAFNAISPLTNVRDTYYRALSKVSGRPNSWEIKYRFQDQTYLDPDMSAPIKYTYSLYDVNENLIEGFTDLALDVKNDAFIGPAVLFENYKFKLKMTDEYGSSYEFSNATIDKATGIKIKPSEGTLYSYYTIAGQDFANDKDAESLKYSWVIDYKNSEDVTSTAYYIAELKYDNANITLTVTDMMGNSKTATLEVKKDDMRVDVIQEGDNFTAKLVHGGGINIEVPEGATWQWYGVNGDIVDLGDDFENITKYHILSGATSETLTIDKTNSNYNAYCAILTISDTDKFYGYGTRKDIVYVFNKEASDAYTGKSKDQYASAMLYHDGNDYNDGRTPNTAVRTMKRAYELLGASNTAKDNIVVVMGYLPDDEYIRFTSASNNLPDYNKNATITGTYGGVTGGILKMNSNGNLGSTDTGYLQLNGATIFEDITFSGYTSLTNTSGNLFAKELFLYCGLNDLTFGRGVKMVEYDDMSANTNGLTDKKSPKITIVGGMHNYDELTFTFPVSNATPGVTTITIESGNYARIIASARNAGNNYQKNSHNIFGSPDNPHRVTVDIAIKHNGDMKEYTPEVKNAYTYDIGLVTGGQTDGSVYVDAELNMISGKVGRFISGNISYGRKTWTDSDLANMIYPSDGFYGSTVLTMEGGEIGELVGGTLGRKEDSGYVNNGILCEAYFYGQTILNVNGGKINNNIYGAGAGGVVGIGNDDRDDYHTKDKCIPYVEDGVLKYGDYNKAKGRMPKMILRDGTVLDLAKSRCQVNINGGEVNGNVYGGGYGYAKNIAADEALDQAGYLFGNTEVNINGGTVYGNVYGGGAGSAEFYLKKIESNKAAEEEAYNKFSALAKVHGNTYVTVRGGVIEGDVYAGSQGVAGFHGIKASESTNGKPEALRTYPDMAAIIGDTYLVVKDSVLSENTVSKPVINGNIFGGSKMGRVMGDTHVKITGGYIGNNIFGGSEGIATSKVDASGNILEDVTIAYVNGSTNVEITGGSYFNAEHNDRMSAAHKKDPSKREFNIYGGGYNNCIVISDANVNIYTSLLTSFKCLLENRDFSTCVKDETYRKFSVYGAGRGILTDVIGNAYLNIDITGGNTATKDKPEDVAGSQQFFVIAGGGYAGNVYGNTKVTLKGNVFARRVYGGGMYGRIEGSATMDVLSGSYYGIYGGGLLGDIMKGANLTVGTKSGNGVEAADASHANRNLYVYENVFGGNDVGGVVGYVRTENVWKDRQGKTFDVRVFDKTDNSITYRPFTRHEASDDYGVNLKVYGGNILGDVFGAGNGDHMGYYVPNYATTEHHTPMLRMMYDEGPAYLYRFDERDPITADKSQLNDDDRTKYGLYEYRPRVSRVRMHIGGNSEHDRLVINGSVYGGGLACTIGNFDPTKSVNSAERFLGQGSLKINFGSHVTVGEAVYMGCRGSIIGAQTVVSGDPADYALGTLNSDYDFHYYDETTKNYLLGFPDKLEGRNMFHAYTRLIDMEAKTQLTFYSNPADDPSYDPATFDIQDVRWGSFFAGGARGSMTYNSTNTNEPAYEYTFPAGLTIENMLVGGSEDAEITYYDYVDKGDGTKDFTSIDTRKKLFTYHGGIVYDNDATPEKPNHGGDVIWHNGEGDEYSVGVEHPRGEQVVVRLIVNCAFDPQEGQRIEDGEEVTERFGGLVYGGCYKSGITNGSVDIVCSNNLLGSYFNSKNFQDYLSWSSLKHNVGRVYGGGFGTSTEVRGKATLTLKDDFRAFNIFGGGMQGNVTLGTKIRYEGGSKSAIYNAIYGGGMRGDVGKAEYDQKFDGADAKAMGASIELVSGGVDRVYGGAFMGDVYGGTHIVASDSLVTDGTLRTRLLVGSIFGGNDVTGVVHKDANTGLSTDIKVSERPHADKRDYTLSHKSDADPNLYYGGYPLIGSIYGAGNGNMNDYIKGVTIDRVNEVYNGGKIHIASGIGVDIDVWDFAIQNDFKLPNVETTSIRIYGGTIVNAYAGGSMCTVTENNHLYVNYTDTIARAAVETVKQDPLTWGVLRLFGDLQKSEVTKEIGDNTRFSHQIYRVFGGNNLMDMDIQPNLELVRGQLFSAYSGGNFGKMTYPEGLQLTIDSPDIRIDAVYGGGRVGDIDATEKTVKTAVVDGQEITTKTLTRKTFGADKYGATLNIKAGIIGDVFGGNNVAGTVYNGTNVNISGAISGNVYGSGNGNYLYQYDYDNSIGESDMISEGYQEPGGRYFILPKKEAYPGVYYGSSDEEKILAINSYRPNVDKSYLNIQGTETSHVFVLGNVYCGGNSSTVHMDPNSPTGGDIKFEIGSHVTLGGVFLGSNGEGLANPFDIGYISSLNNIDDFKKKNEIETRTGFDDKSKLGYVDADAYDKDLYPNLLSLYMRAAEVTALPSQFIIGKDVVDANIGNFTIGGNRGSMMTDETINLTLPENLNIFGRVVGGCFDAEVEYKGALAQGGMIKKLKSGTDKLHLQIKSHFRPWRMIYDQDLHKVSLVNDRTNFAGEYDPNGEYYTMDRCNIYGGCYTSGSTVGNIRIDLYSDVLGLYENGGWGKTETINGITRDLTVNRDMLMRNEAERRTVYALIGGGYGAKSVVKGDIHVRMLPKATSSSQSSRDGSEAVMHPSIATIFGGSHDGQHIGTSRTEVRDGMIFSSLYGGSRAALKYGSTEIVVGYPEYYICKKSGIYTLQRADNISYVAQAQSNSNNEYSHPITQKVYKSLNADNTEVIKQTARYYKGDIVARNVVGEIVGYQADDNEAVTNVDFSDDSVLSTYFTHKRELPTEYDSTWDNIDINIGDNSNMNNVNADYYGGGGIYGGGHAFNASSGNFSGIYTQLAYTADNNPGGTTESTTVGYGGNSTIVIGDNPSNTAVDAAGKVQYTGTGPDGEKIKDHISIGTGHYVAVNLDPQNGDKIGLYVRTTNAEGKVVFQHQEAGLPAEGVTYYRMETEGGVFGDGRRTFVERFRAVDIEGYGYADSNPQDAKLINTFQRMDVLTLTDCCLQLQGATDYATNAIDATIYAVARVGELNLTSSLRGDLTPSTEDASLPGNLRLDSPRVRNYMGFFHNVHYLGAIRSNTPTEPTAGDATDECWYRGPDGKQEPGTSYRQYKVEKIRQYESIDDTNDSDEEKAAKVLGFKKRNMATAPNMIGINNGYTLKVQNVFTTPAQGAQDNSLKMEVNDNIYYGPILGIVEVKMLTLAEDEGGGYIYAFNKHTKDTSEPSFLEASGNFVYPAAIDSDTNNYIVDDCYPASYYINETYKDSEEVHYWYVTGHHYYFNATLTGYTFNGPRIDFRLNNTDNLILLSGIDTSKRDSIKIESIAWDDHAKEEYKCALTDDLDAGESDSRDKYQLFLTLDSNTENDYNFTNTGHAFVAQIPNGNVATAAGLNEDGTIRFANNYSDISATQKNLPLLGIHLIDTDSENQDPTFYHEHLEEPHYVTIKIKAEDIEGKENFYTIRLTINYLQGPYISGKLVVENCALPGEYIYANTSDVDIHMDESMTVTAKRWYLYPLIKDDVAKEVYTWDNTTTGRVDVSQYLMENTTGDVNRVQLPARYYQDGWKLGYSIVVNGQDFPLTDPDPDHPTNVLTVHNYHRMSTVADAVRNMTDSKAGVGVTHGGYPLDLDLVGGALVYIEDDLDFELFTKYVNYCSELRKDENGNVKYHDEGGQQVATLIAEVLPGYNPNGYITGYTNGRTIESYLDNEDVPYRNVKNPSGAENIRFVLANDVNTTANCMEIKEFRGILNGNGHIIRFNSNYQGSNFLDANYGTIRDLGVVTTGAKDEVVGGVIKHTYVFKDNFGSIDNVYYYNYNEGHLGEIDDFSSDGYTSLIGFSKEETSQDGKVKHNGRINNCYQNTNQKKADELSGLRYRTSESFHNGMVAYNLNQQYLNARYLSEDDDDVVREKMFDPNVPEDLSNHYLYNYYADGEYRYAYVHSTEHPEGLRSAENFGIPNYENNLNNGRSMHNTSEDVDNSRLFTVSGNYIVKRDNHGNIIYNDGQPEMTDTGYFPIYIYSALDKDNPVAHSDFINFGQRLAPGAERDYYPVHVNADNRVYRATGCYGTRSDYGFHFNREAWAMDNTLTAIDFTGYLDLKDSNGKPIYAPNWNYYLYDNTTNSPETEYSTYTDIETYGEIINRTENQDLMQLVFYPPVLDLPGGDKSKYINNIKSFDIVSNTNIKDHTKITKNLLVYTPEIGDGENKLSEQDNERLFGNLHYTRMQQWGDVSGETDQNDLVGHQLYYITHGSNGHFHAYGGLFHLADEQDFNAPIEFYVAGDDNSTGTTGRAWMKRAPQGYSKREDSSLNEETGFTISKDAWESIALPFTCNRVVAVNSGDYHQTYSRGAITHFYGTNEKRGITHHDYWLRGLVDVAKDNYSGDQVIASADFARPGKSTAEERLFEVRGAEGVDEQMRGDYSYTNNWFYETYKVVAYNEHHNEYADSLMFVQYCYLTKNAPYIVAFPGPDYYEFDLSGAFYNEKLSSKSCKPQEILYEFTVDEIDPNNNFTSTDLSVRIPVTDNYSDVRHTQVTGADGTKASHHATFRRLSGDQITDNMYVLNASAITANVGGKSVTLPAGTAFVNCKDYGITAVEAFRTYMTVELEKGSRGSFIIVGQPMASEDVEQEEVEEPEEPQTPAEELEHSIKIWTNDRALMVSTTDDVELYIYNMTGQTVRYIKAFKGVNRYDGLPSGFYIVNRTKVRIP